MKGFRAGLQYLSDSCPHMNQAMTDYGRPRSRRRAPGFATLVRIIIDQQVSVQAGAAIWGRLQTALGAIEPVTVLNAGEQGLRSAGLSGPKARYVLGIADTIRSGDIDLQRLGRCRDDRIRSELTALKGVGQWTADIYLMFALGRSDIWPIGDIALQAAAGRLLGMTTRPSAEELDEIGERWRPYRSVAAVMLWHFYKRMPAAS